MSVQTWVGNQDLPRQDRESLGIIQNLANALVEDFGGNQLQFSDMRTNSASAVVVGQDLDFKDKLRFCNFARFSNCDSTTT